jgi:hypothetical protein
VQIPATPVQAPVVSKTVIKPAGSLDDVLAGI